MASSFDWAHLMNIFTGEGPSNSRRYPSDLFQVDGPFIILGDPLHSRHYCNRDGIRYIRLPTLDYDPEGPIQSPQWSKFHIPLNNNEVITGFKLVEAEGLLVVLISEIIEYQGENTYYEQKIKLLLLEFPSGALHPAALRPVISLSTSRQEVPNDPSLSTTIRSKFHSSNIPDVVIAVYGDSVGILLIGSSLDIRLADHFHVYNWKTGSQKLHSTKLDDFYTDFAFLSEDIAVFPSLENVRLDLCLLSTDITAGHTNGPQFPICSLELPEVNDEHVVNAMRCSFVPRRSSESSTHQADPTVDDIVVFSLRVESLLARQRASFKFVIHRRSLLDIATAEMSSSDRGRSVKWSEWGPSQTRWFKTDDEFYECVANGQYYLSARLQTTDEESMVKIHDFSRSDVPAIPESFQLELPPIDGKVGRRKVFNVDALSALPYTTAWEGDLPGEEEDGDESTLVLANLDDKLLLIKYLDAEIDVFELIIEPGRRNTAQQ